MPPVDSRSLARLLNHLWAAAEFAPLVPSMRRTLVRSARPAWVGDPVRHTRCQSGIRGSFKRMYLRQTRK
jgi:hypothetical protein